MYFSTFACDTKDELTLDNVSESTRSPLEEWQVESLPHLATPGVSFPSICPLDNWRERVPVWVLCSHQYCVWHGRPTFSHYLSECLAYRRGLNESAWQLMGTMGPRGTWNILLLDYSLSQLLGFETSVLVAVESKAEFTPCQCFSFVRFWLSSEVDQAFSKPAGTAYQSVYINHALCVSDTLLFMPSDDPLHLSWRKWSSRRSCAIASFFQLIPDRAWTRPLSPTIFLPPLKEAIKMSCA